MAQATTIILSDDGRHVSVGRYSEPSEAELAAAAEAMRAQGMGCWLVEMTGTYYAKRGKVALSLVRELAAPRVSFAEAEALFQAARAAATR